MKRNWVLAGLWAVAVVAFVIDARMAVLWSPWGWAMTAAVYASAVWTFGSWGRAVILRYPHENHYPSLNEYVMFFRSIEDWAMFVGMAVGVLWPLGAPVLLACVPHLRKGSIDGPDRQAEADPPDPGPGTVTLTFHRTATGYTGGATAATGPLAIAHAVELAEQRALTPEIEVVESDMPILAHRAARIVATRDGLRFGAVNAEFGTFGRDADATCPGPSLRAQVAAAHQLVSRGHRAPGLHCTCGFYAVPADMASWHRDDTVDLLVELSGTVIEHEAGYRAAHQRVVEVRLPDCCYCGRPSTQVTFRDGVATAYACDAHLDKTGVVVSLDDLTRQLGVRSS